MKRQKGNLTDWEGLELQDTAVPLWLRLGLLDPRCLEEAGPGTSEEEVLPLGRGVRSLAPSSPRTESSEKGCHPMVLGGSVTSLVLGVWKEPRNWNQLLAWKMAQVSSSSFCLWWLSL